MVVAPYSQCDIGRNNDVSPVSSDQTTSPFFFFSAWSVACESAVGLCVLAESLLECKSCESPFSVVIKMHDGRTLDEEHVVVPIYQIGAVVVAFFVQVPQFVVSEFFHIHWYFHGPRLNNLTELIPFFKSEQLKVDELLERGHYLFLIVDEVE